MTFPNEYFCWMHLDQPNGGGWFCQHEECKATEAEEIAFFDEAGNRQLAQTSPATGLLHPCNDVADKREAVINAE